MKINIVLYSIIGIISIFSLNSHASAQWKKQLRIEKDSNNILIYYQYPGMEFPASREDTNSYGKITPKRNKRFILKLSNPWYGKSRKPGKEELIIDRANQLITQYQYAKYDTSRENTIGSEFEKALDTLFQIRIIEKENQVNKLQKELDEVKFLLGLLKKSRQKTVSSLTDLILKDSIKYIKVISKDTIRLIFRAPEDNLTIILVDSIQGNKYSNKRKTSNIFGNIDVKNIYNLYKEFRNKVPVKYIQRGNNYYSKFYSIRLNKSYTMLTRFPAKYAEIKTGETWPDYPKWLPDMLRDTIPGKYFTENEAMSIILYDSASSWKMKNSFGSRDDFYFSDPKYGKIYAFPKNLEIILGDSLSLQPNKERTLRRIKLNDSTVMLAHIPIAVMNAVSADSTGYEKPGIPEWFGLMIKDVLKLEIDRQVRFNIRLTDSSCLPVILPAKWMAKSRKKDTAKIPKWFTLMMRDTISIEESRSINNNYKSKKTLLKNGGKDSINAFSGNHNDQKLVKIKLDDTTSMIALLPVKMMNEHNLSKTGKGNSGLPAWFNMMLKDSIPQTGRKLIEKNKKKSIMWNTKTP